MPSLPMQYLNDGNYTQALEWMAVNYLGYGMFFMFFGVVIFAVTYAKTQSFGISGIVFILWGMLTSSALPFEIGKYFYLIYAVLAAVMLGKIIFGR